MWLSNLKKVDRTLPSRPWQSIKDESDPKKEAFSAALCASSIFMVYHLLTCHETFFPKQPVVTHPSPGLRDWVCISGLVWTLALVNSNNTGAQNQWNPCTGHRWCLSSDFTAYLLIEQYENSYHSFLWEKLCPRVCQSRSERKSKDTTKAAKTETDKIKNRKSRAVKRQKSGLSWWER